MKTLLRAATVIMAGVITTSTHADDTPLNPRYMRGMGVLIDESWEFALTGRYTCPGPDGTIAKYSHARNARHGVLVAGTIPESPATKAGIACGDVILLVDDREVGSVKSLREQIHSTDSEALKVLVLRPNAPSSIEEEWPLVATTAITMLVGTIPVDTIAPLVGKTLREKMFVDGEFGHPIELKTESKFFEYQKGTFTYTCELSYEGGDSILSIDSFYLWLLEQSDRRLEIPSGGKKVYSMTATAETEGIPTMVRIPIVVARQIGMDSRTHEYLKKHGGSVGKIGTGRAGDWYTLVPIDFPCFLPERLARRINAHVERFKILPR